MPTLVHCLQMHCLQMQDLVGSAVTEQLLGQGKIYLDTGCSEEAFLFITAHQPMVDFLLVHDPRGTHFRQYWVYKQVRVRLHLGLPFKLACNICSMRCAAMCIMCSNAWPPLHSSAPFTTPTHNHVLNAEAACEQARPDSGWATALQATHHRAHRADCNPHCRFVHECHAAI